MFLEIQDLTKTYIRHGQPFAAVDHISFAVDRGEILAIAGESGSGKSTLSRLICQFAPADSGHILLDGTDITHVPERKRKELYRHVQMVFQHPFRSFHPRRTLRQSVMAGIENYKLPMTKEQFRHLLQEVRLPEQLLDHYPHEVSGGECQRAAILRALCMSPKLLICDEATSALDVSTRGEVARLIRNVCKEHRITCLFITHDLLLAQTMADQILVMQHGHIVETGTAKDIFEHPKEAYTKELLASLL